MTITNLLTIALVLSVGFANPGTPVAETGPVTITVRETVDVAGASFTLGEIAEIGGPDKELVKQLSSVVVGASPLPGLARPLGAGDILIRLRYNHFDSKRYQLRCPAAIHVTRASSEIPIQDVVKAAVDRLTDERKGFGDSAVLEPAQLPMHWYVGPGKREYQATVSHGSTETGPVTMQVTVLV